MINRRKTMSCEQFSARMAHLVAAGEDLFSHPHVRQCKLHRALLEDLEGIARAARQMFPEMDPPDTLWAGIEARIEQEFFVSLTSDQWPGYRVVINAQAIEGYNPDEGPPGAGRSGANRKSATRLNIPGAGRSLARRERRQ